MPMQPFGEFFPRLAEDETRVVYTLDDGQGIPADAYALLEHYCNERRCDCRRVLLNVVRESTKQTVAMINLGLYSDVPMARPFLDPLHPRAPFAGELLELVETAVLSDERYMDRLRRHYRMFKDRIEGRRGPAVLSSDEAARRIEERKRRDKAFRRVQRLRRRG